MANTTKLGWIWKPLGWGDGEQVPRVTFPDGTLGEAMAALGYGWDANASIFRKILVDGSGNIQVGITAGSATVGKVDQGVGGVSAWKVDGSAVTQPISATSLPLPAGASTDSNLTAIFGTPGTSPVAAYTVLDKLEKIRLLLVSQNTLLQQLVMLQTPVKPKPSQPTLLHRS